MYKLIMLVMLIICFQSVMSGSCEHGRGACIASCMIQNCATGYCPNGDRGICRCTRCNTGPAIPLIN